MKPRTAAERSYRRKLAAMLYRLRVEIEQERARIGLWHWATDER